MVLAFLVAPPAGAVFPGANGRIAYSRSKQFPSGAGIDQLFTIDPDGTDRTRLTSGDKSQSDPAWAPDGLRIAFIQWFGKLRVMDADGSNPSTVLELADLPGGINRYSNFYDVAWSPDGSALAFCALDGTLGWKVFTVGLDGSGLTKLSGDDDSDCTPAWSPDGATIAIEILHDTPEGNLSGDIALLAADGSTREVIVSAGNTRAPNWAPSGAQLTFTKGSSFPGVGHQNDIYIVNADGTGLTQVSDTPKWEMEPVWSPDGTRIAFLRKSGAGLARFDLWTMAMDGSSLVRVTHTPHAEEFALDWQPI